LNRVVIQITDLYKYYGNHRAIGPLSATIEPGEIVGLLGLNGSGKTTTLRILTCDLLPTSGTVRVGGLDVVEHPEQVRSEVGYLPEIPPLYGDMTTTEFLKWVARLRGLPAGEVERRTDEVIELTEIGSERHRMISTLSHGFRQRVGIAQAIVHRPKVVVLDEPISGLDPKQIVEMRSLVRNLGGEHTVVVSSHILNEISETCDRILVIRDGEIAAAGTERDLFSQVGQASRVDVTVRVPSATEEAAGNRLRELISALSGVTGVELIDTSERGPGVVSARVTAAQDVRSELCRSLVRAEIDLLGMARSEHELESVFLQLSGATPFRPSRAKLRQNGQPPASQGGEGDGSSAVATGTDSDSTEPEETS
jgi:ABC-2 type transport system ATP-binding protein